MHKAMETADRRGERRLGKEVVFWGLNPENLGKKNSFFFGKELQMAMVVFIWSFFLNLKAMVFGSVG